MARAVDPNNPRCFLDVTIAGEYAGRMVFELYVDEVPKTTENFRALCTGECGDSETSGRPLHYKGSRVHKIAGDKMIVGGDISAKQDGSGGESIFGEPFEPESVERKHDRAGILSMEATSVDPQRRELAGGKLLSSQFVVTLKKCPERDGECCAFGRLIRGYGVLRQVEKVTTGNEQQPLQPVVFNDAGELEQGDDGVLMGADGDPFTPWPQDYPSMVSDKGDSYLARVAASETIKSFGNEAFNSGDFVTANRKYTKALRYLEKVYTRDAEVYSEEMEHKQIQKKHSIPLLLNLAAVQLKLGEYRACIESCNRVHEWENRERLPMNPEVWNSKMLYRRGMARVLCNDFEEGIADLGRASMLEPGNMTIRKELQKGIQRMEDRKNRERNAYAKMFG